MMKHRLFVAFSLTCISLMLVAQTPTDSIAIVQAPWKISALHKGIISKEYNFDSLYGVPLCVSMLEVHPSYRFDVLVNAPMESTSVSARSAGAIAAINGSFFDMQEGFSVCYLQQRGVVSDTTAYAYFDRAIGSGAIYMHHRKVKLIPWGRDIEKSWKVDEASVLVSGPVLLIGRQEYDLSACNRAFVETRHPRSAIAVTADGKVLLLTVDGRLQGNSEGIRLTELAHLLRVLGAEDAINLDGGGSTTLWASSAPGTGVLNHPSGNQEFDQMGERKVANIICVYE